MPNDSIINPFAYWDDDMDRQLAEYAAGSLAADTLPAQRALVQDAASNMLGPSGGLAFGEGMAQEQLNGAMGPSPEVDLKELQRQRGLVRDAATNALGTSGGLAFQEGMSKELMNAVAGAPKGRAYIAQATGPVGTIGTMGQGVPGAAGGLPLGDMSGLSADLAAATPADIDMGDTGEGAFLGAPIEFDDDYVGKVTLGQPRPIAAGDSFGIVNTDDPMPPEVPADDPIGASVRDGMGLGEPDAISGGALPGQDHLGPGQTSGVPQMPDEYLTGDELGDAMAGRSLEERAQFQQDIEGRRQDFMTAEVLKARAAADQAKREAAQRYQQRLQDGERRLAENSERARQLANEKIDPLKDIGTGTKIAGVLAAFIGGFAANQNGGRNVGLEAIDDLINRSIQTQTANLAHQKDMLGKERNAIAEEMANGATLKEAQTTVALAAYDSAMTKLQTDLQNFDPRGAQALQRMKTIEQLAALRQQAAEKARLDRQKQAKYELDRDLDLADLDLKRADIAIKQAKVGGMGAAKPAKPVAFDDAPRTAAELRKLGIPVEDSQVPPEGMSISQAKAVSVAGKAARENSAAEITRSKTIAAPPRLAFDASGAAIIDRNTGNLKQADGSDWIIPSDKEAEEFRKKKAAADSIVQILDEIRSIRDRVGGESSWGNSPEFGRLQVLKENLVVIKKAGTQGMSSDADMGRLEKMLGADNPASFRSQAAKLEAGRDQVERQLNTEARALKYTGKDITYPDPLKHKAKSTPEEKTTGSVLIGQGEGYEGGAALRQRKLGDLFSRAVESTNPKDRQAALRELEQGVESGASDEVRDAYRGALQMARTRLAINPTITPAERDAIQQQFKKDVSAGNTDDDRLKFK
jgi:hypothetical protein